MNVLNRKMFANRDARRKLSNMGGILASSPELMSTAQMFANGGPATVPGFVPVKTKTVMLFWFLRVQELILTMQAIKSFFKCYRPYQM